MKSKFNTPPTGIRFTAIRKTLNMIVFTPDNALANKYIYRHSGRYLTQRTTKNGYITRVL